MTDKDRVTGHGWPLPWSDTTPQARQVLLLNADREAKIMGKGRISDDPIEHFEFATNTWRLEWLVELPECDMEADTHVTPHRGCVLR